MDWMYSCPKCTAILNPGPNIILLGRHEGYDVLLAFHPEPGNYEVNVPHNVTITQGEVWDFLCPVCHANLALPMDESLGALDMTNGRDQWHTVVFSRVAGEHATFVISRDTESQVEKHGVDLSKYDHCLWHKYI